MTRKIGSDRSDNWAIVEWTGRGTFLGEFYGNMPTGRSFKIRGMWFFFMYPMERSSSKEDIGIRSLGSLKLDCHSSSKQHNKGLDQISRRKVLC